MSLLLLFAGSPPAIITGVLSKTLGTLTMAVPTAIKAHPKLRGSKTDAKLRGSQANAKLKGSIDG